MSKDGKQRASSFTRDLLHVCLKHGLVIDSCGCCESPFIDDPQSGDRLVCGVEISIKDRTIRGRHADGESFGWVTGGEEPEENDALKGYSTYKLVNELKGREGVDCIWIEPHQPVKVEGGTGPAVVLVVTD